MKEFLGDELLTGMQQELRKYAADDKQPDLTKAAECLHAALEILEGQGLHAQADQLLQVLQKIAQTRKTAAFTMPSIEVLMREGLTKHELIEAGKGDMKALAKFNLVLRRLGLKDHEITQILGHKGAMPEQTAKDLLDPNRALGNISEWIGAPTKPMSGNPLEQRPEEESELLRKYKQQGPEVLGPEKALEFKSIAQKKTPKSDPATKGLTPAKEVENLLQHGHPLNMTMADDANDATAEGTYESMLKRMHMKGDKLGKDEVDPELADLLDLESFDIDASDDELMGIEIKEDSLEVFDKDVPLADFEDERD